MTADHWVTLVIVAATVAFGLFVIFKGGPR